MGELDSSKASSHMKELARTIANDVRGINVKSKDKEEKDTATELEIVSQSHQSFVSKAKNFFSLIELLVTLPEYKPKKSDLTTASLMAYYSQLDDANNGIAAKLLGAKNAGIGLNNLLYAPETGLVAVALMCKDYMKGLFGARDPRFKMVNGI